MTKEEAIRMSKSGWWVGLAPDAVVAFQLFEERLCMDFGDFQMAVEKALGRPVFTHELAYPEHLRDEFLGHRPKATFEEVMNLIPEEKRIVILTPEHPNETDTEA